MEVGRMINYVVRVDNGGSLPTWLSMFMTSTKWVLQEDRYHIHWQPLQNQEIPPFF